MAQLSWISASSGNWSTASDWSGGAVPTATDDVTIAVAGVTVAISSGQLTVDSITTSLSTLSLTGGALTVGNFVTFGGAYQQSSGTLLLEDRGGTFNGGLNLSGGLLDDQGQDFTSNGTVSQSGGTLVLSGIGAQFNNNLVQTAGIIDLKAGTLAVAGAVTTLNGTVEGNGTLLIEGQQNGLNGTTTLGKSTVLSIGKVSLFSGVLALSSTGTPYSYTYAGYLLAIGTGTLTLGGNTLVLSGHAELADQISGGGTVSVTGGAQLNGLTLNNAAVLSLASSATLVPTSDGPGLVTLENNSSIDIASGAALQLTGNDLINDVNFNASIFDNGTLSRASGAGTAEIVPSFTEAATASVTIGLGDLDFAGDSDSFSGTVSGAGTFSLGAYDTGQPQSFTFGTNIKLSVSNFLLAGQTTQDQLNITTSLSYAGNWDQSGGLFLFGYGTSNPVLTLSGSVILDGGVIKSSTGTINTMGLVSLSSNQNYGQGVDIEGFTQFNVSKQVRQDASIQFGAQSGSKPTATIEKGGSWLLEDGASITGPYGTVINEADGTLEKIIGSAVSSIDGTLLNSGLFEVASSQVLLDGSGTLGGTVSGLGQLDLEGNGTYQVANGVHLSVSHVLVDNTPFGNNASVVLLDGALSYAGVWAQHGGMVQLNGFNLTLASTTALDGGTLTGPGTLVANGAITIDGSTNSTFTIGSQAVLDIAKSAEESNGITVSSLADLSIAASATFTLDDTQTISGGGSITVAGALNSDGLGYTSIDPATVVTGQITAANGTLAFIGSVSGTGALNISSGAQLDLENSVAPGTTINMAAGSAGLLIGDAPAYEGLVSGFVSTDFIEIAQLQSGLIDDSLSANGQTLTISDSSNHTFSINFAQAQTLSGTGSLTIADGSNGYIGVYHT